MKIVQFLRILNKNFNLLLLSSVVLAVVVFVLTRRLPETYETDTEIYTGLISGTSVETVEGGNTSNASISNQFDNLINVVKSRQTLAEVGERLLYQHLSLEQPQKKIMGQTAWEKFQEKITPALRDSLYVSGDEEESVKKIEHYKDRHYDSWEVKSLFDNPGSPYSYEGITANLSIKRIGSSDLVQITYKWTDPGICLNTLEILNTVFKKELTEIKLGQSNDVVEYFQKQVDEAKKALNGNEDTLRNFRIKNKIINYQQQTQNIASLQNSLEQQYQEELRTNAAAKATMDELAKKLELNKKVIEFSDELLDKRKKLADLNSKIAQMEVYYNNPEQLGQLRSQAAKLKAELDNNVTKRYQYGRTTEGVSNQEVLQQWLNASIAYDASQARLKVLANRNSSFQNAYDEFSPLGSELARLERAQSLAEKNYLDLSESLHAAIRRQQSEALSTGGLVVTVPPQFPVEPLKSKQALLVLVAAVVGFIVPLVLIFLVEFLDNTIKTPERGEEKTGLKLIGAYPELNPGSDYKNVDMDWLRSKAGSNISQGILHEDYNIHGVHHQGDRPVKILLFSTRIAEGKTLMTHTIARYLTALQKKVLVVSYKEPSPRDDTSGYEFRLYQTGRDFINSLKIKDIIEEVDVNSYDYVLFDLPPILTEQYPIDLLENFEMAICITSAKRAWNKADKFALSEFSSVLKVNPRLLLNGVAPDNMDAVLGEIKKSRSAIRRFLKSLVTLQFKNRDFSRKKAKTARQKA